VWNTFGKGLVHRKIFSHLGEEENQKSSIQVPLFPHLSCFQDKIQQPAVIKQERKSAVLCLFILHQFQSVHGTVSALPVLVIPSVKSEVSWNLKSFGGKHFLSLTYCTEAGSRTVLALRTLIPGTAKKHMAIKKLAELCELCEPQMMFSLGADQVLGKGTKDSYLVKDGFMLPAIWTLNGAVFHLHYARCIY